MTELEKKRRKLIKALLEPHVKNEVKLQICIEMMNDLVAEESKTYLMDLLGEDEKKQSKALTLFLDDEVRQIRNKFRQQLRNKLNK